MTRRSEPPKAPGSFYVTLDSRLIRLGVCEIFFFFAFSMGTSRIAIVCPTEHRPPGQGAKAVADEWRRWALKGSLG